jgi:hypothetical protein
MWLIVHGFSGACNKVAAMTRVVCFERLIYVGKKLKSRKTGKQQVAQKCKQIYTHVIA